MRSRSRWNGERSVHSSSGRARRAGNAGVASGDRSSGAGWTSMPSILAAQADREGRNGA